VRNKNLPTAHDLGQGDGAILAPVLGGGDVIDENDEVVGVALVDHLGGGVVSASHF
jgi:hypothetical protein